MKKKVFLEETATALHITPTERKSEKPAEAIERFQAEVNNYGDNRFDIIRKEKIKSEKKAPTMQTIKTFGPVKLRMSSTGRNFMLVMSFAAQEADSIRDEAEPYFSLAIDHAAEISNLPS